MKFHDVSAISRVHARRGKFKSVSPMRMNDRERIIIVIVNYGISYCDIELIEILIVLKSVGWL